MAKLLTGLGGCVYISVPAFNWVFVSWYLLAPGPWFTYDSYPGSSCPSACSSHVNQSQFHRQRVEVNHSTAVLG